MPVRGRFLLLSAVLIAGCSRSWYRRQADQDAYSLEAQHIPSAVGTVGRLDITPNSQSRMADPYDPDKPPKPPDDPAAAFFMARPGNMKGYSHWDKFGNIDQIEPPNWEANLGLDDKGVLKLTQDRSVEIALVNSPTLQSSLEDVYIQALSLSLNRFDFDCQWFGRSGVDYLRTGASSLPGESNLLTNTSDLGFTRNFAAGGQLLVDFANSFVWEFTGRMETVGGSVTAQLVQPLLRGFGRNVRLESLTQSERNMLYAVRDYARFRKQFWADVAIESNGYLDLLLQVQAIRNAKLNLHAQEENYRLNIELYRGNKRSVVEVDQALQGLLSARQQLLDSEIGLQNSLDTFKRRLGLPPRIPVELDDSPLNEFILIDPDVEALRNDLEKFDLARKAELDNVPPAASLRESFDGLMKLVERTNIAITSTQKDLQSWHAKMDRTLKDVDEETRLRARETYKQNADVPEESRAELAKLKERIAAHKAATTDANRPASWVNITDDVKRLFSTLDELSTAQTLSRIYLIELPMVETNETEAMQFAKDNRLDLQNAQARVTDAWRQMDVAANALRGTLNLTTGATLRTAPDSKNPFNFSNDANQYHVGVQFDGPLNRMAERNAYRTSQITYERAKKLHVDFG